MNENQKRVAHNLRQIVNNCLFGYICNSIVSIVLIIATSSMFADGEVVTAWWLLALTALSLSAGLMFAVIAHTVGRFTPK